ncbi:UNVERIFIED_CONTAM: hypothetical protein RMT77_010766 [Armadillidium vulgare]
MEKSHSYMECDSIHTSIESEKNMYLNDWINIFISVRFSRGKNKSSCSYSVQQIKFSEFLDLKSLASRIVGNRTTDSESKRVNRLKMKVLRYEKEKPSVIFNKCSPEEAEFRFIKTFSLGRPPVLTTDLPKLYKTISYFRSKKERPH